MFFYNLNGTQRGLVPFTELQCMAAIGKIGPQDLIWREGQPNWVPSSTLADLRFPGIRQRSRSRITQHPALFCFLLLLALSIFAIPTYFVFASVRYRSSLTSQEMERAHGVIDRLDKERNELFEQQRGMQQQSLTLDNIHEELTLQYATTQESTVYRTVTKQRLDDVDRRIAENDRKQTELGQEIEENRRKVAHECQILGIAPDVGSGKLLDNSNPPKADAK